MTSADYWERQEMALAEIHDECGRSWLDCRCVMDGNPLYAAPQRSTWITNATGHLVNYGLFSIKDDKPGDHYYTSHETMRRIQCNDMREFGVQWNPDITF